MSRAAALLDRTAELVDIASVSHDERAIADHLEALLRSSEELEVVRIGENVVARSARDRPQRLLLGGHLDTVPPKGNERAQRGDDVVTGVGSADMKGGLAILVELARGLGDLSTDVTFVFYAREEVARRHSGLLELDGTDPKLLTCDAAVLLEPTGAVVEAGCQGVLRVELSLGGVAAHSARPWTGRNAIHRAGAVLSRIAAFEERRPVLDGCEFHESLQVVRIEGGGAANVVPDVVHLTVSHRFAPDRNVATAYEALEHFFSEVLEPDLADRLELVESAPSAPPSLGHPLLATLVKLAGAPPRAKLAWTDVAFFAERGRPAANFGPGDPLLAHTAGEKVSGEALERTYAALSALLAMPL